MRIIYLHPHFTASGGAGRAVLEVGTRLAARGHDVHCICIRADPSIVGDAARAMVFHELGGPLSSDFAFWARFSRSCKQVRRAVDSIAPESSSAVLFPQVFPANWWAASVLRHQPDRPCAWFCHEPSAFIHSDDWIAAIPTPKRQIARILRPVLERIDFRLCQRFGNVLVNSQFSRAAAQQVYGYSDSHCEVAYLGVDSHRFRPREKELEEPSVCAVAKLTRFKNVDQIIMAMAILRDSMGYEIKLDVVGDGDCKSELVTLAKSLRLQKVCFHGRVSDDRVAAIMQEASLFCIASVKEPFGLVAIEALACGTPVVAVKSGGPQEILADRDCGILIDQPTPQALANAFRRVLEDPGLQPTYRRNAVTRAADFDWSKSTDSIESCLRLASNGTRSVTNGVAPVEK